MNLFLHELDFRFRCSMCDYEAYDGMLGGESIGQMVDTLILYLMSPCPKCNRTPEDQRLLDIANKKQETIYEIVAPDGVVHYRRPEGHPDLDEARKTKGYTVRKQND